MAKRVFFSFHYQDVADFRANVVRNSWVIPTMTTSRESAGFFDASIWETARKTSDLAIKRLIHAGLERTTATAVLIGSETYRRRWVRYEIMKSLERGNRVIGIHINSISCKQKMTKPLGLNPFDALGLSIDTSGRKGYFFEHNGRQWVEAQDHDGLSFSTPRPNEERGKAFTLSHWLQTYDWVAHQGNYNFAQWIG